MLSKENDLHSIKIIDFGLSAQHFDKLINNDYCGTYIYMAPEQIEKKLYFISVDIWSIGILMFILLNNGKHPFYIKGDNKKDFVKKIMDGKINFYNKVSPMAKHLILKLLEPNPSWRYTAAQAIKHPWITRNKNDEVPLTFNELLKNSNSKKIAKDLFNVCLFMNYFSKKNKYKFNINQEYIFNCNLYDKKIKEKIIKKKEKCLDILSTDEGDEDSDDNLSSQKKYFPKTREKSYSLNYKNRQSSMIISSRKNILHNKQGELKANNLKSSKVVSSIFRKFSDKKSLNFKKLSCQPTASSNAKIVSNYKKSIGNNTSQFRKKSHNNNLIKSLNMTPNKTNQNKNQQTSKENANKDIEKEKEAENKTNYKEENINNKESAINRKEECKSRENIHNDEEEKPEKIYKYYSSKKIRNRLPHIISPQRINYLNLNKQQFSLNDIENYNIVPILLPHIGKIKKEKNNNDNKRIVKMKLIKNEI
jgi:serine/threonine protein kinase